MTFTFTCRTPGCASTVPHNNHLVIGTLRFGMRVTREQATVFMPGGVTIAHAQPGAVSALRYDVRAYLARLAS